jgi:hypothetical protein
MRNFRESQVVTPHASQAETATLNSPAINVSGFTEAIALLNVSARSGTTPTLDVKAQTSWDGNDWYDLGSAFTQVTAPGSSILKLTNMGPYIRFVQTIGGTTPSFTYLLTLVLKS